MDPGAVARWKGFLAPMVPGRRTGLNLSSETAGKSAWRRLFLASLTVFIAAFGLIPFVALSIVCAVAAGRLAPSRLACLGIGGLVGILALMIPGHVAVWYPLYGPGHMSSTAVIAFLLIPFYCLGSLAIGLIVGWLVSLLPPFRHVPRSNG